MAHEECSLNSPLVTGRLPLSSRGRWLSPDPAGTKAVTLTDPQTWNLYAYVRNNPTTLTDPTGLVSCASSVNTVQSCEDIKDAAKQVRSEKQAQQQLSFLGFLGQEVAGVWDATGGGLLSLAGAVLNGTAEKNVATTAKLTVTNPRAIGEAIKEGGQEAAQTAQAAAHGDPRAIGQIVGTAATVAYTVENIKVRAYENSGGGGITLRNTPTAGSRISLDLHPIEEAGPYLPHADIVIKQPTMPFTPGASGEGSNLVLIKHWPWE